MPKDMIGHLAPFLDTSSLASLSSLDGFTADILRKQLELSSASDELRDELMYMQTDYVAATAELIWQYITNPESKQQSAIGKRAIQSFVRDVADNYRNGQAMTMPGRMGVIESTPLIWYMHQEFPGLFMDAIRGIMGPDAFGIKEMLPFLAQDVADRNWLEFLSDEGRSRLLWAWFQDAEPSLEENEPLTIKLIQNLPLRGYKDDVPFFVASILFDEGGTHSIWKEIAKFLGEVDVSGQDINSGFVAIHLANRVAEDSDDEDDALFAAMLGYLERTGNVDKMERIYDIIASSNQPLSKTRAVLDNYMASESAWDNLVLA